MVRTFISDLCISIKMAFVQTELDCHITDLVKIFKYILNIFLLYALILHALLIRTDKVNAFELLSSTTHHVTY